MYYNDFSVYSDIRLYKKLRSRCFLFPFSSS